MKRDVKITTYWDSQAATRLMEETLRTGIATASLIRFHALRSLSDPAETDGLSGGAVNKNIRTRLNVENR